MNTRLVEKYFFCRRRLFAPRLLDGPSKTHFLKFFAAERRGRAAPEIFALFWLAFAQIITKLSPVFSYRMRHPRCTLSDTEYRTLTVTHCSPTSTYSHTDAHTSSKLVPTPPLPPQPLPHIAQSKALLLPSPLSQCAAWCAACSGCCWPRLVLLRLWPSLLLLLAAALAAATAAAAAEIEATRSCRVGR